MTVTIVKWQQFVKEICSQSYRHPSLNKHMHKNLHFFTFLFAFMSSLCFSFQNSSMYFFSLLICFFWVHLILCFSFINYNNLGWVHTHTNTHVYNCICKTCVTAAIRQWLVEARTGFPLHQQASHGSTIGSIQPINSLQHEEGGECYLPWWLPLAALHTLSLAC